MAWNAEDLMFDPSSVSGNGSMRTPVRGSDGTDLGTQPKYAPGGGPWLQHEKEHAAQPPAPTTQGLTRQRALNQVPDPGPGGGVTITMDPANGGDIWARIQQAAKAGLISPDQVHALSKKLGVGMAPPNSVPPQQDVASNLGGTLGGIVGGAGRAVYDKMNAPAAPGAPLNIQPEYPGGPEYQGKPIPGSTPPGLMREYPGGPDYQPPSPAWNQ